jgi:hypothetical protein
MEITLYVYAGYNFALAYNDKFRVSLDQPTNKQGKWYTSSDGKSLCSEGVRKLGLDPESFTAKTCLRLRLKLGQMSLAVAGRVKGSAKFRRVSLGKYLAKKEV